MFWKRLNISHKTQNCFRIFNFRPEDWVGGGGGGGGGYKFL